MVVDNEAVREALINLERSREKEQLMREQANSLLEGLEIITSASGTEDMLSRLLQMVTAQLKCDDAFILSPAETNQQPEETMLNCIGTTDPVFSQHSWLYGKLFQRVHAGQPVMLFNTEQAEEWKQQSEVVREKSGSALLISFPGVDRQILICCISQDRAYFTKGHLGLMQRLVPIASHALHTLYINEQLQCEIDERNRLEQYSSFQAGIAEMNTSILHNIGNSITGAQGYLLKLEHARKNLFGLVKVMSSVEEWLEDGPLSADQQHKLQQGSHGAAKLLKKIATEDGEIAQGVAALERSNRHISEIIQMQRGVSRPILTASWFKIDEMVNDTISMVAETIERHGIFVEVEIDRWLEKLYLPRNPMIQMLLNLIKNSVESIDECKREGATIEGKITVSVTKVEEWIELRVEDDGMGIDPEWAPSIFKFGQSSKRRGTGFGLHSAANFITGVGGSIEVESAGHHQGAVMIVQLPIEMAEH